MMRADMVKWLRSLMVPVAILVVVIVYLDSRPTVRYIRPGMQLKSWLNNGTTVVMNASNAFLRAATAVDGGTLDEVNAKKTANTSHNQGFENLEKWKPKSLHQPKQNPRAAHNIRQRPRALPRTVVKEKLPKPPFNKTAYDIMNMKPIPFNSSFKNPCWYGNGDKNGLFNDHKLHCLPYFFLIGVKKCGTSDLFNRILGHPQVPKYIHKELQWFGRIRWYTAPRFTSATKRKILHGDDPRNVTFYVDMFDKVSKYIEQNVTLKNGAPFHNMITGDATPSNLHLNLNWEKLPGNEGLREPAFTNLNYMKHLIPKVKIIIIMRDPTSRLFSDFKHTGIVKHQRYLSPETFHADAVTLIGLFNSCLATNTLRACTYNNTLRAKMEMKSRYISESFTASFYSVYLMDIYKIFPKRQVLTLLMSEYIDDMPDVLRRVFKFLELDPVDAETEEKMLDKGVVNTSKSRSKPMLGKTKRLLDEFFKPFNEMTAKFMNDPRYLFATYNSTASRPIS